MRNEKLITAREERGWTQEKAAEKIGVSRVAYARWEGQGVIPHLSTISMACEAFKMTPQQLGFRKSAGSLSLESDEDVDRRKAIQEIGKFVGATSALLMMPQTLLHVDDLERLARTLSKPSSMDREMLRGLKRTTENYWRLRLHGDIASPDLLVAVLGHYRITTQLLQGSLLPTTRALLYAVVSETLQIAGMLSTDLYRYDLGQIYYQTSLVTAQESNDDVLYAAGLGRIGALIAESDKPQDALPLFREVQHIAVQYKAFGLYSWLAAEEAEARADMQDSDACFSAFEKVECSIDQIRPDEHTYGTNFNHSRLLAYQGACQMQLHQPYLARPALEVGLNESKSSVAFTRSILLDLAEVSIQTKEIERACNDIYQAVELITQTKAVKYLQRVRKLRRQLDPWAKVQAVKDLYEQLRSFNSSLI